MVVALAIAQGSGLPSDPGDLALSLFFGVVAAGAYMSFFTALRIGPLAVVSPVVAAYGGLTVVAAVLIRDESLTLLQAVGAALATAGVVLTGVVFEGGWRGTRIVGRGVVFSLIAMLLFTVLTVGLATPIRSAGWLPVVLGSRLANAVTVWIVLGIVVLLRSPRTSVLLSGSPAEQRGMASTPARAATAGGLAGLLDVIGTVAFAIGLRGRADMDRRARQLVRAGGRGDRRGRAVGRAPATEPVAGSRGDRGADWWRSRCRRCLVRLEHLF